jgi:hypothetical protein
MKSLRPDGIHIRVAGNGLTPARSLPAIRSGIVGCAHAYPSLSSDRGLCFQHRELSYSSTVHRDGEVSGAESESPVLVQPSYSPRLNQGDVVAWDVFLSVADVARKLRKYIRAYAKSVRPFRWILTDPRRRIRTYEITGRAY